jgi:dTDP-4-dehydrorhamnose reductase
MPPVSVLVLGANGMLGHAVMRVLSAQERFAVHGTQVEDAVAPYYLNAESPPSDWAPLVVCDYIINCIGMLKPAVNESDAGSLRQAIVVNALFPHRLAEAAAATGARILHMSTDGVFSGHAARPYVESDPTDCPDAYGKTKALGECPAANVLNIRCSIIGRDPVWGKGLVERVLRGPDGAELCGFEDQIWNGVSTLQFGRLCRGILEQDAFDRIRRVSPVHHFCPNSSINKYDLLCLIREAAGKQLVIRRARSAIEGGFHVLGTCFAELRGVHPDAGDWRPVISDLIANKT